MLFIDFLNFLFGINLKADYNTPLIFKQKVIFSKINNLLWRVFEIFDCFINESLKVYSKSNKFNKEAVNNN